MASLQVMVFKEYEHPPFCWATNCDKRAATDIGLCRYHYERIVP